MIHICKTISAAFIAMYFSMNVASAQSSLTPTPDVQAAAEKTIGGQISAFRDRDHIKAFSYAAPGIQKMFGTTDRFITMVKSGFGAIYGARNWSFGRSQTVSGSLYQEVLLTGPQGKDWIALYTLSRQSDGSWRISSVQIKPGKSQST